jgi:hypothetical protein
VYAHLVMSGACRSWSDARHEMDLPTLAALTRYWDHSPPVHVLVARYLGIKGPTPKASAPSQGESIDGLIQLINSGAL